MLSRVLISLLIFDDDDDDDDNDDDEEHASFAKKLKPVEITSYYV